MIYNFLMLYVHLKKINFYHNLQKLFIKMALRVSNPPACECLNDGLCALFSCFH